MAAARASTRATGRAASGAAAGAADAPSLGETTVVTARDGGRMPYFCALDEERIAAHLRAALGGGDGVLVERTIPSWLNVFLYQYPPTPTRPHWVIATMGLSGWRMPAHEKVGDDVTCRRFERCELLAYLPASWPNTPSMGKLSGDTVAQQLLKQLCWFTVLENMFLWRGDTIGNFFTGRGGDPFYRGSTLAGAVLVRPREPALATPLAIQNEWVNFYAVVPLTTDEYAWSVKNATGWSEAFLAEGVLPWEWQVKRTSVLERVRDAEVVRRTFTWAEGRAPPQDAELSWKVSTWYGRNLPGHPADEAKEQAWLRKAAESGDRLSIVATLAELKEAAAAADEPPQKRALLMEVIAWFRRLYEQSRAVEDLYDLGVALSALPDQQAEGLRCYLEAAEQNYVKAMTNAGWAYEHGHGVAADAATARSWYLRAVELGDALSMYNLGRCCKEGVGGPVDLVEAAQWFERSANAGMPAASFMVANLYENGYGVPQDDAKACAWYTREASDDSSEEYQAAALYALGFLHEYGRGGDGVRTDQAKALYKQAAAAGHELGRARCAEEGFGTPKDPARAVRLYRELVDEAGPDDEGAAYYLGRCYSRGVGVAQDHVEAVRLYRIAAPSTEGEPDPLALCALGECYERGLGVPAADPAQAAAYYRAAAERGHPEAMRLLAQCPGVDPAEATKWMHAAAAATAPRSQGRTTRTSPPSRSQPSRSQRGRRR